MTESAGAVRVTFAEGVKDEIADLTKDAPSQDAEVEALKCAIAKLFLECKDNPYSGELMGPGRHPELSDCRRIQFDIEGYKGKPRFRLIYRNEPSDGVPDRGPGS
jgi:transposase